MAGQVEALLQKRESHAQRGFSSLRVGSSALLRRCVGRQRAGQGRRVSGEGLGGRHRRVAVHRGRGRFAQRGSWTAGRRRRGARTGLGRSRRHAALLQGPEQGADQRCQGQQGRAEQGQTALRSLRQEPAPYSQVLSGRLTPSLRRSKVRGSNCRFEQNARRAGNLRKIHVRASAGLRWYGGGLPGQRAW